MKDKILGTLYYYGIATKLKIFWGKSQLLDGPYENKVARNFTKGQFTDDTAQSLLIIDALNKNHFEPSKKS